MPIHANAVPVLCKTLEGRHLTMGRELWQKGRFKQDTPVVKL